MKRKPKQHDTVAAYWGKMTPAQRRILMNVVNGYKDPDYQTDLAALPFVKLEHAYLCLRRTIFSSSKQQAVYVKLLQLLGGTTTGNGNKVTMRLALKHARVVKKLGTGTNAGLRIPFAQLQTTTAGLKWSLPHRGYIPDDEAKVWPMYHITFEYKLDKARSVYEVTCPTKYSNELRNWLLRNCT